jgi:hypothetical protein
MGAATFTSCEDDEEEATEKATEQGKTELQVVKGGKYSCASAVKAFSFEVTSVEGSYTAKNQVVKFTIDGVKDQEFTLSDAGTSYLMRKADGTYEAVGKEVANANASSIVMVLAYKNSKADYTITSGTVNDTLNKNGAKETKFAEKQ